MAESGTYTPEAIARRLQIAQQLLDSSKAPPIVHWTQGLNELAKGALGGDLLNRSETMEANYRDWEAKAFDAASRGLPPPPMPQRPPSLFQRIAGALGGDAGTPAAPPAASSAVPASAGMPSAPAPAGPLPAPPPTTVSAVPKVAAALSGKPFNPNPYGDPGGVPVPAATGGMPTAPGEFGDRTGLGGNPLTNAVIPGLPPPPPRAEVPSSPKVVGDAEARATGLYPPEPSAVPATPSVPTAPPAATAAPTGTPTPPTLPPGIPEYKANQIRAMFFRDKAAATKMLIEAVNKEGQVVPLTDAERSQWKIPTDDKTPWGKDINTGRPVPLDMRPTTQINQQGMLASETTYSKGKAEDALALERSADKMIEERSRIGVFKSLVDRLQTGKLAPMQATVGAWADALGIDPSRFGVPKNTAMDAQLMESMSNQMTLGMIGGTGGMPANNFSDADRKFLQSTTPGLSKLPGGNQIILEMKERALDRHLEKVSMWDQYRSAGRKFEDFERDWRAKVSKEPLFADIPDKIRALGAGPAAAEAAPAAAYSLDAINAERVRRGMPPLPSK